MHGFEFVFHQFIIFPVENSKVFMHERDCSWEHAPLDGLNGWGDITPSTQSDILGVQGSDDQGSQTLDGQFAFRLHTFRYLELALV